MLYDPGDAANSTALISSSAVLPSVKETTSAIPSNRISGLNHFNLSAYGLSSRHLRLTHFVTSRSSRLASKYGERRFSEGTFTPIFEFDLSTPRGALLSPRI